LLVNHKIDVSKVGVGLNRQNTQSTPAAMLPLNGNYDPNRGTLCFWFQPQRHFGRTNGLMFNLVSTPEQGGPAVAYG
jgi:hypothetical protein